MNYVDLKDVRSCYQTYETFFVKYILFDITKNVLNARWNWSYYFQNIHNKFAIFIKIWP